ncbi:hypothetical protein [Flavobacterium aestivum]|uniref:hypothetical protein n=1 Tax=Flavobacterium aestivum TaxID=3003257 RepID=UPI0022869E3D|nr:hypothetical protein [Flavobacterium aestivum]
MKNILIFALLLSSIIKCSAQESPKMDVEFYSPSKNEKLSTEAYEVFRTNKFLNFKDKDTFVEKINGTIYKKTDLNNFFSYKKDWEKIQKEDTASYPKKERAKYLYTNNTMIEAVTEFGNYNVHKEIKTVYNPKCFVLQYEKKYFVGDDYNRTESIFNEYDNQNRVVKIIKRTEQGKKENNEESIITVKYEDEIVTITSKNGTIACELISNGNSVGWVSTLSPNETADYFRYAIGQQKIETAKEYCTEKMIKKIDSNLSLYQSIIDIKSLGGTGRFGEQVTINEDWKITFKDKKTEKYNAVFTLVKQKNGWKIDDFEIRK